MSELTLIHLANPGPLPGAWAYQVVAAGRSAFDRRDGKVTRAYHQHTMILTLSGEGLVEIGRACHAAVPGSLTWLNTSRPYAHGAAGGGEWVYLWLGVQGAGLDILHKGLGFHEDPVARLEVVSLQPDFEALLSALSVGDPNAEAVINRILAQVLETLAYLRRTHASQLAAVEPPIARLCRLMRQDPGKNWTITEMTATAGMSAAQLFRRFRQETGTTPRSWLRRERIEMAGHLLSATPEKITSIALRCGYGDPFHFSRDFKKLQGQSPRSFRLSRRASAG